MIFSTLTLVFSVFVSAGSAAKVAQPEQPAVQPAETGPASPMEIHVTPSGGAEKGSAMEINVKKAAPARPSGEILTADDLLGALEAADANVNTMTADLVYDKTFDIAGDRQIRWGKLSFTDDHATEKRGRKFAIVFDRLRVGDRLEKEEKQYIFDGRWLVERLPGSRQFIKTEVVREGDSFDPLKIGEGPMPIPIGQKRDETLARFDAELLKAGDGIEAETEAETAALVDHTAGTFQLKLVPKAGTEESKDFREIRLWYRKGDAAQAAAFLPVMARTVNRAGDISLVRLNKVALNGKVETSIMDTSVPGEGWKTDVRRIRGAPR